MPKFNVRQTEIINAPIDQVYGVISDFSKWNIWSPWLIMEPDADFKVSDDHKYYSWEGKRVGSGNMKITNEEINVAVDSDLQFLTPWKSFANIRFELKEVEGGTEVAWLMSSSLPFYLFFLTKMMIGMMEMDFSRGLNMLKDYLEQGEVNCKLKFKGESDFQGFDYIGITRTVSLENIGEQMSADFTALGDYLKDKSELATGKTISIYHKWDIVKKQTKYTAAVSVGSIPEGLPELFKAGKMPSTKIYTVRHIGPYHHLGNAWSTGMNLMRSKVFKKSKATHPFEVYQNMPGEVSDKELITDVCFAAK